MNLLFEPTLFNDICSFCERSENSEILDLSARLVSSDESKERLANLFAAFILACDAQERREKMLRPVDRLKRYEPRAYLFAFELNRNCSAGYRCVRMANILREDFGPMLKNLDEENDLFLSYVPGWV